MDSAITAFERKVLETAFKQDAYGELLVASKLQTLLRSPETFNFNTQSCTVGCIAVFQKKELLPPVIRNFLEDDFHKIQSALTGGSEQLASFNFEGVVDYEFNKLFKEGYRMHLYADVFARYDQFSLEKIERLCRTAELLRFAFDHYKSPIKFNILFTKLKPFVHFTTLRMTSIESARKLISRKEIEGLPGCLGPIGSQRIAEALADPKEFRRKAIGHFDFFRASAPLVKVSIDAYVIQIKYFDEDDDKLREFVVIHFHDDFSDCILSSSLDDSENGESFLRALRDYLRFTKGALPRTIYVDGFTNRILKQYPHIVEFLERRGVIIEPSPNPNSKSSLERCLLTVQQKQLPKSIHYIGPGIKTKKPLSHPAKQFLMVLNHKSNALAKWELARLYKYLVEVGHNKQFFGRDGYAPRDRYTLVASDQTCAIDLDLYLPYLTYCKHEVTVTAGAVRVPLKVIPEKKSEADKMRHRNITTDKYENRAKEFKNKVEGELINAYIDDDDPLLAHIYLLDTQTKVGVMKLFERVPNNEYDRTEAQKAYVNRRNAESAKIENELAEDRIASLKRVNDVLGFDLHEVTEEARAMWLGPLIMYFCTIIYSAVIFFDPDTVLQVYSSIDLGN